MKEGRERARSIWLAALWTWTVDRIADSTVPMSELIRASEGRERSIYIESMRVRESWARLFEIPESINSTKPISDSGLGLKVG
jgi:hypothetical protein